MDNKKNKIRSTFYWSDLEKKKKFLLALSKKEMTFSGWIRQVINNQMKAWREK